MCKVADRGDIVKPNLWIEGLIASGKSRLTGQLETALGFRSFPEPVADKGYLELFYSDQKRWAFSGKSVTL